MLCCVENCLNWATNAAECSEHAKTRTDFVTLESRCCKCRGGLFWKQFHNSAGPVVCAQCREKKAECLLRSSMELVRVQNKLLEELEDLLAVYKELGSPEKIIDQQNRLAIYEHCEELGLD